jgi:hypothetical protein
LVTNAFAPGTKAAAVSRPSLELLNTTAGMCQRAGSSLIARRTARLFTRGALAYSLARRRKARVATPSGTTLGWWSARSRSAPGRATHRHRRPRTDGLMRYRLHRPRRHDADLVSRLPRARSAEPSAVAREITGTAFDPLALVMPQK